MNAAGILWLDFETTGLNSAVHSVIEIGAICTSMQLRELDSFSVVIKPQQWWNWSLDALELHRKSGLLEEAERSNYSESAAFVLLKQFLDRQDGPLVLAGSSVHFDFEFLKHAEGSHVLDFTSKLHYRRLDATTLVLVAQMAGLDFERNRPKEHRALADCHRSLNIALSARAYLRG